MINNNFIIRENCKACKSQDITTLYSCGFLDSPIEGIS